MEYIRAKREVRHALVISDPTPVENVSNMWASAGQAATIGIFLLLFGAFLYVGHAFVLPVLAAAVVALTLAPLVKSPERCGIPPWITGLLILGFSLGALGLSRRRSPDRSAMDRPRAGDRRQHQAKTLGARSAARRAHQLQDRCLQRRA